MEELKDEISLLLSDDEARYFYHITNIDGEKILEEGLIVGNPSWEQSFLEFNEDEKNDITELIIDSLNKDNKTIIIAGVYKDDMDFFVRRLDEDKALEIVNWEGCNNPDYIVLSSYIIGYIDLDTLEFVHNDRANVISNYYGL